jgi:hypothetical protein
VEGRRGEIMKRWIVFLLPIFSLISACEEKPYIMPTEYVLEFQVTGTAILANIEYQGIRGYYYAQKKIRLPWNYQETYYEINIGKPLYLSAQNLDSTGDLTVTIIANSIILKQATTTDPFGFIVVYGELPNP